MRCIERLIFVTVGFFGAKGGNFKSQMLKSSNSLVPPGGTC